MKNQRLSSSLILFLMVQLFLINSHAQSGASEFIKTNGEYSVSDANLLIHERNVFDLINQKRAKYFLPSLVWSEQAAQAARLHSKNMSLLNFFGHVGMDKKRVGERVALFGLKNWRMIGENIAYNRGYDNPFERVVETWLNSQAHRENLLNKHWRETGVGITISPAGTYYFTQVFFK